MPEASGTGPGTSDVSRCAHTRARRLRHQCLVVHDWCGQRDLYGQRLRRRWGVVRPIHLKGIERRQESFGALQTELWRPVIGLPTPTRCGRKRRRPPCRVPGGYKLLHFNPLMHREGRRSRMQIRTFGQGRGASSVCLGRLRCRFREVDATAGSRPTHGQHPRQTCNWRIVQRRLDLQHGRYSGVSHFACRGGARQGRPGRGGPRHAHRTRADHPWFAWRQQALTRPPDGAAGNRFRLPDVCFGHRGQGSCRSLNQRGAPGSRKSLRNQRRRHCRWGLRLHTWAHWGLAGARSVLNEPSNADLFLLPQKTPPVGMRAEVLPGQTAKKVEFLSAILARHSVQLYSSAACAQN